MRVHTHAPAFAPDEPGPCQEWHEWQLFLDFIASYFKACDIERPTVVEIGCHRDKQRRFYRALGCDYLGLDISDKYAMPDILGDCHAAPVVEQVKTWLSGRPINLLFIDGDHSYEGVRQDYEIYAPMVKGLIAFHDLAGEPGVRRFWNELQSAKYGTMRRVFIDMTFHTSDIGRVGTGIMVEQ